MKFPVEVVRIGYATKTIEVEAASKEEAQTTALDVAGNESFNEHASEYKLVGDMDDSVNQDLLRACKLLLDQFQDDVKPGDAGWDAIIVAQETVTQVTGET